MPIVTPRSKIRRTGSSSFTLSTLIADVTFIQPMPSTYKVYTRVTSGIGVQIPTVGNVTANGFRLSIGIGILATVEWIAIED